MSELIKEIQITINLKRALQPITAEKFASEIAKYIQLEDSESIDSWIESTKYKLVINESKK